MIRHEKYDEATLEINFSISGSARTSALSGAAGKYGYDGHESCQYLLRLRFLCQVSNIQVIY